MNTFSKSERSNHPARLLLLPFTLFLLGWSVYYMWKGTEGLAALLNLVFFFIATVVVIRGFLFPFLTTLEVTSGGLAISLSNRGQVLHLSWADLREIELSTDDGIALYVRESSGKRHKINEWVSLTEDEIGVILNLASKFAPSTEIVRPKKANKPIW